VWVLEVDLERKRISLTARKGDAASPARAGHPTERPAEKRRSEEQKVPGGAGGVSSGQSDGFTNNPFAKLKPK
jgi:uncharacterized protein